MKIQKHSFLTRLWIALFIVLGGMSFSAYAQTPSKDILLYSTDFTDWLAYADPGKNGDWPFSGGAGDGFAGRNRPVVSPTGTIGGYTGYFYGVNSTTELIMKPLEYISGGIVEVLFYVNGEGSDRTIEFSGGTVTQVMMEECTLPAGTRYDRIKIGTSGTNMAVGNGSPSSNQTIRDDSKLNIWHSASNITIRETGTIKVSFYLPSLSGLVNGLTIKGLNNGKIYMVGLKIYTSVGTTPYVASTNYPKAPAAGHSLQGIAGGAVDSGTAVNSPINIRGWNLNGADVKLSIEGQDASKFSLTGAAADGTLTVLNATALVGYDVPVRFTPSVRDGIANALLKIEATGCSPYYVSLTGITGDVTTPKILASTATIPFYTSVIAPVTQTLSLAGINLTNDVTVTFEGTGAERFSASATTITKAIATAGSTINITYLGTTSASEKNVYLVLKSSGAADVRIPLYAVTRDERPTLYDLVFQVSPAGAGFLDLSLTGPKYEQGTIVNVTVEPETGYYLDYWSDNAGSHTKIRSFRVTANKSVTVFMKKIADDPGGGDDVSSYVGYTPLESTITNDGFIARWTSNPDATASTDYTVVVYGKDKTTVINSYPAGTANQINVSGLEPVSPIEESDFFFYYEVVASNVPAGKEKTVKVGPIRLLGTPPFTCGQEY